LSLNRNMRKTIFTPPLIPSTVCLCDILGTYGISIRC
jgi:hypothetical protein